MDRTDQPLVSVIIPFFNDSEMLIEALESVVDQSYTAWEVILVDDGSDARHTETALEFCLRYPDKIKYTDHTNHVNRGVTISRNEGVAKSSGLYIALLDADDKWLPGKLKNQIDLFGQNPDAQMICEASEFWYSWNNMEQEDAVIPIGVLPDSLYYPPALMKSLYPLGEGAPPCPSGIIISRLAFDRCGGFEPAFSGLYTLYEDQGFFAKIYLNEIIYVSGVANNLYRKRAGSMSSAANDIAVYEKVRKFFLHWLTSYLKNQNKSDDELFFLIQAAYDNMPPGISRV